jgi:hypothetical protein
MWRAKRDDNASSQIVANESSSSQAMPLTQLLLMIDAVPNDLNVVVNARSIRQRLKR